MYRIILSLILVLINSSLISSQNPNEMDGDYSNTGGISLKFLITFIFFILLLLIMVVGCICSIRKRKQQVKVDLCKNITTTVIRQTNSDNTDTTVTSTTKVDELDLENNWITDVYSNNNNLRKDIFGFKKKFYNFDNDSLQSVHFDDDNSKIMKSSGLNNVITPPPYVYDPSSTPNVTLTLDETIPKKDLTERALDFLIKNPPKDVLPTQAEIHSILKVHENISLNPYSSWKFLVENNVVEESGVVQITNYGKLVEINTRKWSSTTNDVCVQANYPFFVPKSTSVRRNSISISTPADRLNSVKNSSTHIKRNSSNAIKPPTIREEVIHYFEVTVLSKATDVDTIISVGLSTKPYPYFRLPGWNKHSVGYQSNNGSLYHNDMNSGKEYALSYTVGDTIGCGYKPGTNEIFFTKNGDYLGPYTTSNFTNNPFIANDDNLRHIWYPTIAANGQCKLEINFGGEISEGSKDLFKYKLARNFGPGAPISVVKQLRGGELIGSYEKCKSENVELERVGL
ncbi:unnamed protein product [Rhizophagus irregularis]|nr:unnamed protein product [Rhizophagus irregularis]CAB4423901.1 unnamed protein product [Rhizophagus irregularis]